MHFGQLLLLESDGGFVEMELVRLEFGRWKAEGGVGSFFFAHRALFRVGGVGSVGGCVHGLGTR